MDLNLVTLLVLGFAAFRLTRLVVIDTLTAGLRNKVHSFLINRAQKQGKLAFIWEKLYELSSCTWCAGFWVSLGLYTAYLWNEPWDFTRKDWIIVFAIAGIQGLLHAYEPDDE